MDKQETVGNGFGRDPLLERDGSMDIVDGQETVGNSFGRAPLGGSETEAWTSWTDGKPWEIAFGASEKEAWISFGRAGNRAK